MAAGSRRPAQARQPRLVADGRRQDVQVARQRRPPGGLRRAVRRRRASATSSCARWCSARTPTSPTRPFSARYNADLANDLGNLVSRATTMIHRYCDGVVPRRTRPCSRASRRRAALGAVDEPHRPRQDARRIVPVQPGAARDLGSDRRDEPVYRDARAVGAREGCREARRARDGAVSSPPTPCASSPSCCGRSCPARGERMLAMVGVAPSPQSWMASEAGELDARHASRRNAAPLFPRIEHSVEELRNMSADRRSQHQPHRRPPAPAAASAPAAPLRRAAPAAPADACAHHDRRLHEGRAARRQSAGGRARAEVEQADQAAGGRRHRAADARRRHRRSVRAGGARRPDGRHRVQPEAREADGHRVERDGARGQPRRRQADARRLRGAARRRERESGR